ncbi:MAG: tryptophan 2,3-dioxygenase [Bacteroidetes bacterium]|nr:tryptophan 2,3-dioxygenase [Bacteroidota bacterium]
MEITPEIAEKLDLLNKKISSTGQSFSAYLDGFLHADYLNYWDYVEVDTLLTLQKPRTKFPDEVIFIMYHQVTELYFKLCLHELKQIADSENTTAAYMYEKLRRVNRYFEALTKSFDIMVDGMEKEQFLQFRMSLMPASGFQSAQYRMIEIYSTNFFNLVAKDKRDNFSVNHTEKDIEGMYEFIYWKYGATELATGKKTYTLLQFEEKYSKQFIATGQNVLKSNVWAKYLSLPESEQKNEKLISALKQLDVNVNVNWPLVHYKSAVRYLQMDPKDIAATGGTNWQKYLPPKFQKRIFYPTIWSEQEIADWGKAFILEALMK